MTTKCICAKRLRNVACQSPTLPIRRKHLRRVVKFCLTKIFGAHCRTHSTRGYRMYSVSKEACVIALREYGPTHVVWPFMQIATRIVGPVLTVTLWAALVVWLWSEGTKVVFPNTVLPLLSVVVSRFSDCARHARANGVQTLAGRSCPGI
jgi:hypothetical protein